jgi:hypothetical protein
MFPGQEKDDWVKTVKDFLSAVLPLQQLQGIFDFTCTRCQIAAAKASVSS